MQLHTADKIARQSAPDQQKRIEWQLKALYKVGVAFSIRINMNTGSQLQNVLTAFKVQRLHAFIDDAPHSAPIQMPVSESGHLLGARSPRYGQFAGNLRSSFLRKVKPQQILQWDRDVMSHVGMKGCLSLDRLALHAGKCSLHLICIDWIPKMVM